MIYLNVLLDQSCPSVTVNYTGFSITWNEALAGVTVEAPCTREDLNGKIYSYCYSIKKTLMHYKCCYTCASKS